MLTTTEVARVLGLSQRQVQLRIRRGVIPVTWVAGRAMIDPAVLTPAATPDASAGHAGSTNPHDPRPERAPGLPSAARLEAFQRGLAMMRDPSRPLPETARAALRDALVALFRGLHAPLPEQRLEEWRRARAMVVEAAAAAWVDGPDAGGMIEAELLPAVDKALADLR